MKKLLCFVCFGLLMLTATAAQPTRAVAQMQSAKQAGGLTDLYNECKLLNKALVAPIQFPSCVYANRQKNNGGRLHHMIRYRYLFPCILKNEGGRGNIAWDTYPEDYPFTNEPKR